MAEREDGSEANVNQELKYRALRLAYNCVRETFLEKLHLGRFPDSKIGDYSDVKVVTPTREIPWLEIARLDNAEMKTLMIEVVNKVYTFFLHDSQLSKNKYFVTPRNWNEPEINQGFLRLMEMTDGSAEPESKDVVSTLETFFSTWTDYSSDKEIIEQGQFCLGLLTGLTAAEKISFYENQVIWKQRMERRLDVLMALRRAFRRKEIPSALKQDIFAIESGDWVAFDYDGRPTSRPKSWADLRDYRENNILMPVTLIKPSRATQEK